MDHVLPSPPQSQWNSPNAPRTEEVTQSITAPPTSRENDTHSPVREERALAVVSSVVRQESVAKAFKKRILTVAPKRAIRPNSLTVEQRSVSLEQRRQVSHSELNCQQISPLINGSLYTGTSSDIDFSPLNASSTAPTPATALQTIITPLSPMSPLSALSSLSPTPEPEDEEDGCGSAAKSSIEDKDGSDGTEGNGVPEL